MLVYGDHRETGDPRERLRALAKRLPGIAAMPPGIDRHSKLVGALIEAGQLLQGVADEGCPSDELSEFLYRLARAVVVSWDSRFAEVSELPPVASMELPPTVELKLPEGFAFYAVYPEYYIEAARRLQLSGPPRVIGIRSIGATLGAIVAAALNAPPPLTVRPFGDPFARQVDLPSEAIASGAHYIVVDEGPGLSGSSFGSVADALESRGVPLERIAFVPSHGGDPGAQASEAHRRRWTKAQRVAGHLDDAWLTELFGPLEDITGCDPFERRKFLGMHGDERVLIKFAGLGTIGEGKLEMARALHAAGLTPEPLAFVHGFLIERWHGEARPLAADEKPIEAIGRYLGARARLFGARGESGAGVEDLLTMCRRNISLALGDEPCRALDEVNAPALQARVRRVRTDNKLDRHEWLKLPDGRLLKTDALDHHQAHDLIGCQDIAWDVAGAIAEFDLSESETRELIASTGGAIDAGLLAFYRIAYPSFRLGRAVVAVPNSAEAERYRAILHEHLQHVCRRTRRESLVG